MQLSISAQDLLLYTAVQNGAGVRATRLSLPGLTNATQLPSNAVVVAIAAALDAPETAAFASFGGLGVFDGTIVRGQSANIISGRSFTWGFDASTLFGIDSAFGRLLSFYVDGTGV